MACSNATSHLRHLLYISLLVLNLKPLSFIAALETLKNFSLLLQYYQISLELKLPSGWWPYSYSILNLCDRHRQKTDYRI